MSIETLNLLSDSTFGDKLDEQNAILEEIRDNVGGGGSDLKTAAVRSDTPDSQGVSQFYKLDAQGNRTNVYPALSPVGSLNWVVPKIPSLASNTDDIFLSLDEYNAANPTIFTNYNVSGNIIYQNTNQSVTYQLWINALKYGIVSINDALNLFTVIKVGKPSNTSMGFGSNYNMSTLYPGYAVINLVFYGNTIMEGIKILYG